MKTKTILLAFVATLFAGGIFAQDRTTVTATSNDISDNLDLRAVASIFGESNNLEDFERRLNDPKAQISNLDLNGDRQVDYLRVIESVEGNSHIIIVQAVLEKDIFQDVATIEVEKGANNTVQVQVVGDVYMYGDNYIYEPVFVNRPMIYDHFWVAGYRPYWSSWYWGYYPSYYYGWNPYPVYRYRNHIHNHINVHNHYTYVNARRSQRGSALAPRYRGNGYAVSNPGRSFRERNNNVRNTYELQEVRGTRSGTANNVRSNEVRANGTGTRASNTTNSPRTGGTTNQPSGVRTQTGTRENGTRTQPASVTVDNPRTATPRTQTAPRETAPPAAATRSENTVPVQTRTETPSAQTQAPRTETPRAQPQAPRTETPRAQAPTRSESPRVNAPQQSQTRNASPSSGGSRSESRGGGRR